MYTYEWSYTYMCTFVILHYYLIIYTYMCVYVSGAVTEGNTAARHKTCHGPVASGCVSGVGG